MQNNHWTIVLPVSKLPNSVFLQLVPISSITSTSLMSARFPNSLIPQFPRPTVSITTVYKLKCKYNLNLGRNL